MPDPTMTPGPEMDRAVAEVVNHPIPERSPFGQRVPAYRDPECPNGYRQWSPSTSITHAIEALEATKHRWSVRRLLNGCYFVSVSPPEGGHSMAKSFGEERSIPEAACRAILAWAGAKELDHG